MLVRIVNNKHGNSEIEILTMPNLKMYDMQDIQSWPSATITDDTGSNNVHANNMHATIK